MAWRGNPKAARVNPRAPEAWGRCDMSGFIVNLRDLRWNYQWAGNTLINTRQLVRPQSQDDPNEQYRTLVLPPDPKPVYNARPYPYAYAEADPVMSQFAADGATGDLTVFVDDVTGFAVSDDVYVQLANGTFQANTVTAIDTMLNSLTLSVPIGYAVTANQYVTVAA